MIGDHTSNSFAATSVRIGARRRGTYMRRRKQPPLQLGIIGLVRDQLVDAHHGRAAQVFRQSPFCRSSAARRPAARSSPSRTSDAARHVSSSSSVAPGSQGSRLVDSTGDWSDAAITRCPYILNSIIHHRGSWSEKSRLFNAYENIQF